jgi:hypothetical protein
MKTDVKNDWLTALRSGEYEQGYGTLCRYDGDELGTRYCCLGVLCELALAAGVVTRVPEDGSTRYVAVAAPVDGEIGYLPHAVRDWAGLDDINPVIDGRSLSSYNDGGLHSFTEIAELIETYL